MTKFYVDVRQHGSNILLREIVDGRSVERKVKYRPTLYVPTTKDSQYRTLYGQSLQPKTFESMWDAKKYVDQYDGIGNYEIYGSTNFPYEWILDNYPDKVEYQFTDLLIYSIDIETASEEGFPNVERANEEVLLITIKNLHTKESITFGSRPYGGKYKEYLDHPELWEYRLCDNEYDLLLQFLSMWREQVPHVVTGWNSKFFDIPYLVNRIRRVMGEDAANYLSPWEKVETKIVSVMGRDQVTYDIYGVAHIDWLDAYKKYGFTDKAPENYKLDTIAEVELGRNKLENPYETFREFYMNDWDLFLCYNAVDVDLLDALEEHKKLLMLMIDMAFASKVNIPDAFSPVRLWESVIRDHQRKKNVVLPIGSNVSEQTIEGAYVKPVKPGTYDWVVSFDATSLYPSIIRSFNLSPETLTQTIIPNVTPDRLIEGSVDLSSLKEQNLTMTANGHTFSREKKSIFAEITEDIFNKRKIAKGKMLEAKKKYEETKDEKYKRDVVIYNSSQATAKILANSLYGALSNKYFFLIDYRIAEGITLTGQYIIKTTQRALNDYLNDLLKTDGEDYVVAMDTDSCYITLGPVVDRFFKGKSTEEIVDLLDTVCREKITKVINDACNQMADYVNMFERHIEFKREAISQRAIWTAKKRYALTVYDNEGVRYKEPEIKVMGMEIVRSTTPAHIRDALRKGVKICLMGTEQELHQHVREVEAHLMQQTPEKIAFPKGCNNIQKYTGQDGNPIKGTPQHVKGAILYNRWIKEHKVDKIYPAIQEGEKVKILYLREPNPSKNPAIAFLSKFPKEFKLEKYIDYPKHVDALFVDPLSAVLEARGWTAYPVATLDDIF